MADKPDILTVAREALEQPHRARHDALLRLARAAIDLSAVLTEIIGWYDADEPLNLDQSIEKARAALEGKP